MKESVMNHFLPQRNKGKKERKRTVRKIVKVAK